MTAVMDGLPSICVSALWISQIRLSTIWPATAKVKAHSRNIMAASAGMIPGGTVNRKHKNLYGRQPFLRILAGRGEIR